MASIQVIDRPTIIRGFSPLFSWIVTARAPLFGERVDVYVLHYPEILGKSSRGAVRPRQTFFTQKNLVHQETVGWHASIGLPRVK